MTSMEAQQWPIDPDVATPRVVDAQAVLTARETEVLSQASLGNTNAEVAAALGITTHAVKFHLASIFRKLGVKNRTEAVVAYLRTSRELNT
jgi:DNA-binding CsgD family transcriptional regulator